MEVRIRRARHGDAETLVEFNRAMAAETEDHALDGAALESGVRALFDHPGRGFYLIAERGGEPAGALLVTTEWSDWRNAPFWWIQSVYVRPDQRRRGVYRGLHARVAELARVGGACGLRLYVERDNAAAQRTYESLGMAESRYLMYEQPL